MRKRPKRRRPSHYDLQELTKGTSKELGIHAQTVGSVCEQFSRSRDKAKHSLRFHASFGARSARCRFRNRAGRSKATPSPISGSASGILAASAGAPQANGCLGCVLRNPKDQQDRCVSEVAAAIVFLFSPAWWCQRVWLLRIWRVLRISFMRGRRGTTNSRTIFGRSGL